MTVPADDLQFSDDQIKGLAKSARLPRMMWDTTSFRERIGVLIALAVQQDRERRQEAPSDPVAWLKPGTNLVVHKDSKESTNRGDDYSMPLYAAPTHAETDRARLPCWLNPGGCIEPNYCRAPTEEAPHPALCARNDTRATVPAGAADDARDAARLEWLLHRLPGKALRDIGVKTTAGGLHFGRIGIDAAIAAHQPKECTS